MTRRGRRQASEAVGRRAASPPIRGGGGQAVGGSHGEREGEAGQRHLQSLVQWLVCPNPAFASHGLRCASPEHCLLTCRYPLAHWEKNSSENAIVMLGGTCTYLTNWGYYSGPDSAAHQLSYAKKNFAVTAAGGTCTSFVGWAYNTGPGICSSESCCGGDCVGICTYGGTADVTCAASSGSYSRICACKACPDMAPAARRNAGSSPPPTFLQPSHARFDQEMAKQSSGGGAPDNTLVTEDWVLRYPKCAGALAVKCSSIPLGTLPSHTFDMHVRNWLNETVDSIARDWFPSNPGEWPAWAGSSWFMNPSEETGQSREDMTSRAYAYLNTQLGFRDDDFKYVRKNFAARPRACKRHVMTPPCAPTAYPWTTSACTLLLGRHLAPRPDTLSCRLETRTVCAQTEEQTKLARGC
eukprot:gene24252-9852_t